MERPPCCLPACQLGLASCSAAPRECELIASGRDDYADLVRDRAGMPRSDTAPASPAPVSRPDSIPLAGDIVASMSRRIGADRFAAWVAAKLGADCGCEERRRKLNELDAKLRRYLHLSS